MMLETALRKLYDEKPAKDDEMRDETFFPSQTSGTFELFEDAVIFLSLWRDFQLPLEHLLSMYYCCRRICAAIGSHFVSYGVMSW